MVWFYIVLGRCVKSSDRLATSEKEFNNAYSYPRSRGYESRSDRVSQLILHRSFDAKASRTLRPFPEKCFQQGLNIRFRIFMERILEFRESIAKLSVIFDILKKIIFYCGPVEKQDYDFFVETIFQSLVKMYFYQNHDENNWVPLDSIFDHQQTSWNFFLQWQWFCETNIINNLIQ